MCIFHKWGKWKQWKYADTENEAWLKAANQLTTILIDNGIDMDEDYN